MKYCPKCGRPNEKGARFCDNCGTDLADAATAQAPGVVKEPSQVGKKIRRYLIGIILVVILAGGGYITWAYMTRVPTALDVSKQYMDCLKSGNYEDAYKLINPELKLNQDVYIYSMKELDNTGGKVKDYRIDSDQNGFQKYMPQSAADNVSLYQNVSVVIGRNQPETTDLVLTNISAGEKADWRIDLSDKIRQASLKFTLAPKLEVKVCKKAVQADQSGRVLITYLNEVPVPVEVGGPNVVSQSFDFPRDDGATEITLQASEKLQNQLEGLIKGFDQAHFKSLLDNNVENLAPYLVRDGDKWNQLKEEYQDLADSDYKYYDSLKEIKCERGYFSSAGTGNTQIIINDSEVWNEKEMDSGGNAYEEEKSKELTYTIELQPDGSWKIVSIED